MDLRKLKTILSLMEEHGLVEVELEAEGEKVRLKKAGAGPATVQVISPAPQIAGAAGGYPAQVASAAAPAAAPDPALTEVKSPIVGTFYGAPKPGDPPFVKAGAKVKAGQVLCIIEAMKVMNEIKAETDGTVVEILVENGSPVEFGQALLRIRS